jgi:hypothetical protein
MLLPASRLALQRSKSQILTELNDRTVIWSGNGPAGDYAELLVAEAFDEKIEVEAGKSVRYTIESGFPFWNGSVFEWELGPAVRAESGTNLLFRHGGFEDGYPETDLAFTRQTWALVQQTIKSHAEGGAPGPALG